MKLRKAKKITFAFISFCLIAMTMSGCAVYACNKNWDDMTAQEKQEVRQTFDEVKAELEEEFPESGLKANLVSDVLNVMGQAMDD